MIFRVFTFGVAGAVGIAFGMWTVDREEPIVITKYETLTPEVAPGAALRVHYHVKRLRDCAVHIDRVVLDSQKVRYVLIDEDFARPMGPLGDDEYTTEIMIPDTASQGLAIYRIVRSYHCNLVHRWFWPIVSPPTDIPFTVRGSPPVLAPPLDLR